MRATARTLLALAALTVLSPVGAWADDFLLAGDESAAWAAVLKGNTYQLLVKPINAPWESPWESGQGRISAIAPVRDGGAVAVFSRGQVVRYFRHRSLAMIGASAPKELLGDRCIVLSACAAPGDKNGGVLVLVNRAAEAAAKPATQTASANSPSIGSARAATRQLALLEYRADQWRERAVLPAEDVGANINAYVAADAGGVYVLLNDVPPKLMALEQGRWRRIKLPKEFDRAAPLALAGLDKSPAVVAYEPDPDGKTGRVLIGLMSADGQWRDVQAVRRAGKVASWPAPPAAATLGQRVALLWQEERLPTRDPSGTAGEAAERFFGTVGPDGELNRQDFVAPKQNESSLEAAGAEQYFLWGVLGAMALIMFWPGMTIRAEPFSVPEGMRVASLLKRLGAFLVDYTPISVIVYSFLPGVDPRVLTEGDWPTVVPAWMTYGFILSLGFHTVYSIIMEHRFGATLGKMLFHLAVVSDEGRRPDFRQILLRNLSRVPEVRTGLLLLVPLFTRHRQRLGDKLARTAVIDVSVMLAPPAPPKDHDDGSSGDEDNRER